MLSGGRSVKDTKSIDKENKHFEVDAILDNKMDDTGHGYKYLVHWKGYESKYNSWVKATDFDDINIIKKYWKNVQKKKFTKNHSK